ncbi:MAG: hypothetical protein R3B70_28755 [Polyangiaceae bacterium]
MPRQPLSLVPVPRAVPATLLLAGALSLAACDGDMPPPATPADPPAKPWPAEVLKGPYASVADFCTSLGSPPACEERDDVILALPDAKTARKTTDGSDLQLLTVASNDGLKQRAHLLFKRNTDIFALPVAHEYDPKDGARHFTTVRTLKAEASLFILTYGTEKTTGDGATQRQEVTAKQAYCRVAKDFPIACALFDTETGVNTGPDLKSDDSLTAEVFILPAADGNISITAHGRSGPEGLKLLAPPGDYKITFP